MIRFLFGVVFLFAVPYLCYQAAMAYVIPLFGITKLQWLAAAIFAVVPGIPSIILGLFCAAGGRLPDN